MWLVVPTRTCFGIVFLSGTLLSPHYLLFFSNYCSVLQNPSDGVPRSLSIEFSRAFPVVNILGMNRAYDLCLYRLSVDVPTVF